MLQKVVLPAIIAENQEELDVTLSRVAFASNIMLDMMDGEFVKSKSLDFPMKLPDGLNYQLHVMAVDPLKKIRNLPPQINTIILHVETLENIADAIEEVKSKNYDIFLALNPETPISVVRSFLRLLDGVLIMTVNPGQYGAKFLPEQLEKVKNLRKLSETLNIEVDGGMTDKTVGLAITAGANMIASGSFIIKSNNPKVAYDILSMFF
jgi:ribulose-phosphate 3-epimerase